MSTRIVRAACLVAVAALVLIQGSSADKPVRVNIKCPVCEHQFRTFLTLSGTITGRRLDLRPVGYITSPDRIGVCPKCGFVHFKNKEDDYTKDELKTLREYVRSEEYKKLVKSETSYYRLARMFERLKRPHAEVAFAYLKASWQVEDDKKRSRQYLSSCLEAYEKFLKTKPKQSERTQTAQFLKGELLRQLGKFDDASKHFQEIQKLAEFKKAPFPKLIELELKLIGKKDDKPRVIPAGKKDE